MFKILLRNKINEKIFSAHVLDKLILLKYSYDSKIMHSLSKFQWYFCCRNTTNNPKIFMVSQSTANHQSSLFIAVLFTITVMEAAQVVISRWVYKTTMGQLCNGILLSHKKDEILHLVTSWMDMANIILSEISHSEKHSSVWFHLCVESNEQSEQTSKTETDS